LVVSSVVGNRISIAITEESESVRAEIGRYVSGTVLDRWLSPGTRDALLLEGRKAS
jgi:hypothetical protein